MDEKEQWIAELDHARARMYDLLRDLEQAQAANREVYPNWTIKELLAHLTGWDDSSIATLQAHAHGDAPATPAARGIDLYNASTVHEREALSLEQVLREWEQTRETLKQAIRDLPEAKLHEPLVYAWGPKGTVAELVQIFAEHEEEHVDEIRARAKL